MKAYKVRYENYEEGDILGEFGLFNEATIVNANSEEEAIAIVKTAVCYSKDHFDAAESNCKYYWCL